MQPHWDEDGEFVDQGNQRYNQVWQWALQYQTILWLGWRHQNPGIDTSIQ